MSELKLIGTEGERLVLSAEDGARFTIAIDDALREAVRPRLHAHRPAPPVSPRVMQQLMREGRTVEQVVAETGADEETVRRFEGPVIAEREHIVAEALRTPAIAPEAAERPGPSTFGDEMTVRLAGVDAEHVSWHALRHPEEGWRVSVSFRSDDIAHEAVWAFDPKRRSLTPLNPDATTLSQHGAGAPWQLIPKLRAMPAREAAEEREASPSNPPARGRDGASSAGALEAGAVTGADARGGRAAERAASSLWGMAGGAAERAGTAGGVASSPASETPAPRRPHASLADRDTEAAPRHNDTADLLDALRRRRGERERVALPGDLDADTVSAPQPRSESARVSDLESRRDTASSGARDAASGAEAKEAGASTAEESRARADERAAGSRGDGAQAIPEHDPGATTPIAPLRRGRRSMPSWDEIVFGTKRDGE